MSGLLRRLTRRRPATADENRSATAGSSEPAAVSADAPAEPGGERPVPAADEQQTQVLPATGEQPAVPSPGAAWAKSTDQPTTAQAAEPQVVEVQATGAQATETPAAEAGATQAAEPHAAEAQAPEASKTDQPTLFAAQPAPVRDLPAGVDAGDLASPAPASARRGKLRRRLRYLRHVRELLLRDLGGFTYEVHRTAGGTPQDTHRRLSEAKAKRISAIDEEIGALETRLGEPHAETVLREAGIGGTCPECGELHASDARFCARCGTPLDPRARAQRQAAEAASAAQPVTASHATAEPQPASVLWAGGPRPAAKPEEAAESESPGPATSEWLLSRDQPTTFDRAAQPDEPATAEEPAATTRADQPAAAANEPVAAGDEPPKVDEPAPTTPGDGPEKLDEPAATTPKDDDPAATIPGDAPATTPKDDEPAVTTPKDDDPVATTPGDVPATVDEPATAKPKAKPKRRPRKASPKPKPKPETAAGDPATFEPGPNGRRDDDVPPPVRSGDPLASRREQRP